MGCLVDAGGGGWDVDGQLVENLADTDADADAEGWAGGLAADANWWAAGQCSSAHGADGWPAGVAGEEMVVILWRAVMVWLH